VVALRFKLAVVKPARGGAAMRNSEGAMVAYARLAVASQSKRQMVGRDRFLVLAAAAACYAGWPDVAAACRRLVLDHNPRHLVGHWETVPEALRSEDFPTFVRQLARLCSPEQAEHLLESLTGDPTIPPPPADGADTGDAVLHMLATA
jgi:hypothetical protein